LQSRIVEEYEDESVEEEAGNAEEYYEFQADQASSAFPVLAALAKPTFHVEMDIAENDEENDASDAHHAYSNPNETSDSVSSVSFRNVTDSADNTTRKLVSSPVEDVAAPQEKRLASQSKIAEEESLNENDLTPRAVLALEHARNDKLDRAVSDLAARKVAIARKNPGCGAEKQAVEACYAAVDEKEVDSNTAATLECSRQVAAFKKCAEVLSKFKR
jgi:hypothetical protein